MNIFSIMLLVTLIGCGGYCVYTWISLRKVWMLKDNRIMLPGNCAAADCLDPDGFLDFMAPKMLLFGLVMIVLGLLYLPGILNESGYLAWPKLVFTILDIGLPVVTISLFVWFILVQRKAAKLFW